MEVDKNDKIGISVIVGMTLLLVLVVLLARPPSTEPQSQAPQAPDVSAVCHYLGASGRHYTGRCLFVVQTEPKSESDSEDSSQLCKAAGQPFKISTGRLASMLDPTAVAYATGLPTGHYRMGSSGEEGCHALVVDEDGGARVVKCEDSSLPKNVVCQADAPRRLVFLQLLQRWKDTNQ